MTWRRGNGISVCNVNTGSSGGTAGNSMMCTQQVSFKRGSKRAASVLCRTSLGLHESPSGRPRRSGGVPGGEPGAAGCTPNVVLGGQ